MKRNILFTCVLFMLCLSTSMLMALPKVAVLDAILAEGMDKSLAVPITDKIMEELVNSRKYIVLDRNFVNEILKEKEFQLSGMVKTEDIKKAGEYLGADNVVVARTTIVGDFFFVSARMIDVKSGAIVAQTSQEQRWDVSTLFQAASKVGNKLAGGVVDATDSQIKDREDRAKELVKGKENQTTTTTTTTTDTTKKQEKINNNTDQSQQIQTNAVGVKVGYNTSEMLYDQEPSYWDEQEVVAGFMMGIYFEAGLTKNISLGLELQYITKGVSNPGYSSYYGEFYTDYWTFSYVQAPLLFKFRIPFSAGFGMHIGAGPYVAYALSIYESSHYESGAIGESEWLDDAILAKFINQLDYGITIDLDFYFSIGPSLQLVLGLNTSAGLNSVFTDDYSDSTYYNNGLYSSGRNASVYLYSGIGFSY